MGSEVKVEEFYKDVMTYGVSCPLLLRFQELHCSFGALFWIVWQPDLESHSVLRARLRRKTPSTPSTKSSHLRWSHLETSADTIFGVSATYPDHDMEYSHILPYPLILGSEVRDVDFLKQLGGMAMTLCDSGHISQGQAGPCEGTCRTCPMPGPNMYMVLL